MPAAGHYPYQAVIDAYGNGGFRFAGMSHQGSLLCLPSGMHAWAVRDPGELSIESLEAVLAVAGDIDVLLIGTGEALAPLGRPLREAFASRKIVVEAIATGSAVRTYNVLLNEERSVAAALIAVRRAR